MDGENFPFQNYKAKEDICHWRNLKNPRFCVEATAPHCVHVAQGVLGCGDRGRCRVCPPCMQGVNTQAGRQAGTQCRRLSQPGLVSALKWCRWLVSQSVSRQPARTARFYCCWHGKGSEEQGPIYDFKSSWMSPIGRSGLECTCQFCLLLTGIVL